MDVDPAGHEQLISQFVTITDVDTSRAKFYLESSAWNLELAIASFYEQGDPDPDVEPVMNISDDDSDNETAQDVPATDEFVSPHASARESRFATLSSMKDSSKTSKAKDEGQAYYAGGSETSGQQIIGPPKEKNLVDNLFKSAKEHVAEPLEESAGPSESPGVHRGPRFTGAGYRLGDTEDDSEMIQGAPAPQQHKQVDVVLKLWKEGFSVDDGELRDYHDPANKDFLNSISKGEIPKELLRMAKGEVNLDMEDHRSEDYVKPKQSLKAFSGAGHMLGSPAPTVVSHTTSGAAASGPSLPGSLAVSSPSPVIDNTQPVTNIQIRLADGSKLVAKFNHRHQVRDIRNHIILSHPEYANQTFILMTTFPNKELTDDSITLEEAKLLNAVIVQRKK